MQTVPARAPRSGADRIPGVTTSSRDQGADPSPMEHRPGHLIRRAHQIHDALWAAQVSQDATPTQFAVLSVVARLGSCDQATIARSASLDTSTAGSVVYRLTERGWLRSEPSPSDRRRNVLQLTPEGEEVHRRLAAAANAMTEELQAPLEPAERSELIRLLRRLVAGHERA